LAWRDSVCSCCSNGFRICIPARHEVITRWNTEAFFLLFPPGSFGTFSKGERGERMARNPRTGEEIKVEAAKTVKFKAGEKFKDAVNQ